MTLRGLLRLGAVTLGLTLVFPLPARAQEGLARWLDDLLPRGPGSALGPDTVISHSPALLLGRSGLGGSWEFDRRGLGPYAFQRQAGSVRVRRPLGTDRLAVGVGVTRQIDSDLSLPAGTAGSRIPSIVQGTLTLREAGWAGRWAAEVGGRWRDGGGWTVALAGESPLHRIEASHRSWRGGGLHLEIPSADVRAGTRTTTSRSAVGAGLRWPRGRWKGTGLSARWSRERFEPAATGDTPDVTGLIAGIRRSKELDVGIRVLPGAMLRVGGAWVRIDSDGQLSRSDQRAGRLFFGRLGTDRWRLTLEDPGSRPRWRAGLMRGRSDGSLSARLETWPFATVWEQLGAVAYRVRGEIRSRWTAVSFVRRDGDGSGWGAGAGRVRLGLDGEDWTVTGLGFGRSDQRKLEGLEAAVIVVRGQLERPLPSIGGHRLGLRLSGSAPVHATWNEAVDEALRGSEWVEGSGRWAVVTLGVTWTYAKPGVKR